MCLSSSTITDWDHEGSTCLVALHFTGRIKCSVACQISTCNSEHFISNILLQKCVAFSFQIDSVQVYIDRRAIPRNVIGNSKLMGS